MFRALILAQLVEVSSFGSNPGALKMYEYVPAGAGKTPLLVVMHGCTQTADQVSKAGWIEVADAAKIALVFPEQSTSNNPARCFNFAGEYGDPANMERGKGENESIREMVESIRSRHEIDGDRIWVAGISAGGAFAAVMLATWPDVFDGGAIFAGIPYRCGSTVAEATACMNLSSNPDRKREPEAWGDLVRAASNWTGPWPRVAIFHGADDYTVHPDAALELLEQWTNVHGTDLVADEAVAVGPHTRERFGASIEKWTLGGMGHAIPVGEDPADPCVAAAGATFTSDVDLCGAWRSVRFLEAAPVPTPGGDDDDDTGAGATRSGCACATTESGARPAALLLFAAAIAILARVTSTRTEKGTATGTESGTATRAERQEKL